MKKEKKAVFMDWDDIGKKSMEFLQKLFLREFQGFALRDERMPDIWGVYLGKSSPISALELGELVKSVNGDELDWECNQCGEYPVLYLTQGLVTKILEQTNNMKIEKCVPESDGVWLMNVVRGQYNGTKSNTNSCQEDISERISYCLNGILNVGDMVASIPEEEYGGLVGTVVKIVPFGTEEQETENQMDDIYVDFRNEYTPSRKAELLSAFRQLYGDPDKEWEEICLDYVIMAPDMLLKVEKCLTDKKEYLSLLDSGEAMSSWCIRKLAKNSFVNVETPFGPLFAEAISDPSYPGIYLGILDRSEQMDKRMALAEATPNHFNEGEHALRLLVWGTMDSDSDYTDSFTFLLEQEDAYESSSN